MSKAQCPIPSFERKVTKLDAKRDMWKVLCSKLFLFLLIHMRWHVNFLIGYNIGSSIYNGTPTKGCGKKKGDIATAMGFKVNGSCCWCVIYETAPQLHCACVVMRCAVMGARYCWNGEANGCCSIIKEGEVKLPMVNGCCIAQYCMHGFMAPNAMAGGKYPGT